MREHLRILFMAILIYFLISDIIELASYIPTSLTIAPLLQRLLPIKSKLHQTVSVEKGQPNAKSARQNSGSKNANPADSQGTAVPTLRRSTWKTDGGFSPNIRTNTDGETKLAVQEHVQINRDKQDWLKAMQDQCLPKLVCELHASLTGQNSLSDTELGILTAIKDTSLGTSAEVVSKYHFAAHMGQLLAGVEGNGCHNFYPNCPIAKTQVLHILKKVKIR